MHSRKFRNGTKKWRKQHRKFHPYDLIFWKSPGKKWSDVEFCKKLANKIDIAVNSGYLLTPENLIVIDTDDGTKGRHTLHKFIETELELLVPEGAIKYDQDESDEVCLR